MSWYLFFAVIFNLQKGRFFEYVTKDTYEILVALQPQKDVNFDGWSGQQMVFNFLHTAVPDDHFGFSTEMCAA